MKQTSKSISRNSSIFLVIFLAGLGLLLVQHYLFLQHTKKLELQTENQHGRIMLGKMISNNLNKIEAYFFKLPTSSETNIHQLYRDIIFEKTTKIKQALSVIEKGGSIDYVIPLNLPEQNEMVTTITYQPVNQERYILEIIELRPGLLEVEERLESLMVMVALRDQFLKNQNSQNLFPLIRKIKTFLKECAPLFIRMNENTNLLFFKSQQHLTRIEQSVASELKQYRLMESGLVFFIVLAVAFLLRITYQRHSRMLELEQSRQTLADSFQLFSMVSDGMDNIIYVVDLESMEILFANRYTREKFGDVVGRKCFQVFAEKEHPEICSCCIDTASLLDKGRGKKRIIWEREENGKVYEIHGQLIDWEENRKALHVLIFNITDRKQAEIRQKEIEKRLTRSEKMEAIGMMAGGVAHDLNNILSGIISYPELLLVELPEKSEMRTPLETIKASGERAAAVVDDLLTVARGVASSKKTANLNNFIRDYLNSPEFNQLASRYPHVQVSSKLSPDLMNIRCSAIHIQKMLMNLVTNAVEAIDDEGKTRITTWNQYIERTAEGPQPVAEGEYAILKVQDNGPGITTMDLEHIFEPFYTKKVMGRSGTGLGLSVVWNTIQDHNGSITVDSNKQGTTFTLYFPITRDDLSLEQETVDLDHIKGHGELILVVDDEKQQRDIAGKMLTLLGYEVACAANGNEALVAMKEHPAHLLLLDMIIEPDMNGRQVYEKIKKIYPTQKAVIASGFSGDVEVKKAQELGAGEFIKKPYSLKQLGIAVQSELQK